ncbi:hypothetical protein AnigIFM60653_009356 [Aspergillus niger]|nr:hypothetical protein AnigIFM60653_009356 [Aspergillus niger]
MAGERVQFTTYDGLKLAGILYGAGDQRPCVIMTNGGESEGTPRNEVDPLLQTRDYYDAFNYAATLPSVDATKIVYWGSSMSGGNALVATAVNKCVKGVICQVPFISSETMVPASAALCNTLLQDRASKIRGQTPLMGPVVPASREEVVSGTSNAMLKDASAVGFVEEMARRGLKIETMVTLQSLLHGVGHEPAAWVRRVAPRPLLMVVADQDTTCPAETQLAVFNKALHPKTLHILRGASHFEPYFGPAFEENIQVQLSFLKDVFQ